MEGKRREMAADTYIANKVQVPIRTFYKNIQSGINE